IDLAVSGDRSAHRLDEPLHDREPEARAAELPRTTGVDSKEALEDPRKVLLRDSGAIVGDRDEDALAALLGADPDPPPFPPILERVVDEVVDHLLEAVAIAVGGRLFVDVDLELHRPRAKAVARR